MIIFLNMAFTIAVLYTFLKVGSEPTVLIGCWFGFTTGELWMLSGITKKKISDNYRTEDNNEGDS